jgi:peptide methionine sulfoxide reductase MsrA
MRCRHRQNRAYRRPDHGTQYRSVIFYADEEQQRIAKEHPQLLAER